MKIVADDKIPFLKGVLEPFADVVYVNGKAIDHQMLQDADALLTRTRTRCDEQLLKDTKVKFIGTATIGYDHIDTGYCESHGITWKNAPGCNASSVNQYIASALVHLSKKLRFSFKDKVLGVVGVGNVGSKIVQMAETLGMQVHLSDPPRVRNEGACGFISLDGIIRECDIITFHVPLNRDGQDKTYHMINDDLLRRINPGTIIINASRGEVAHSDALQKFYSLGRISAMVLDVWENEPHIDQALLKMATIATPHIAGYSVDGKAKGTSMVVNELSRFFNLGFNDWEPVAIPAPTHPEIKIDCYGLSDEEIMSRAIMATYNIAEDDQRLRDAPVDFEKQRGSYPPRREFKAYTLVLEHASDGIKKQCRKLGFNVN